MSEKITCFYCGKELKEDVCKMSVVIDTAMVYKNTKFSSETKIGEFTSINRLEVVNKLFHRLVDAEQKKDGSLQREISKIIGELEENFEDRLKLDYQIFLHVLKKTAKEFNLL
jgi:hypothetical protein